LAHYLFIESQDPFEDAGTLAYAEQAEALAREGERVTLWLIENGVHAARAKAQLPMRERLVAAGVSVLADTMSLRERGIGAGELHASIEPRELERAIDLLADGGTKAVFH
jgi:hypothetical protein